MLQVVEVVDGRDVVCTSRNSAMLDGLLTVYHQERSADGLSNLQVCCFSSYFFRAFVSLFCFTLFLW